VFLVVALPAIVLGVLVWQRLPNHPREARWLAADETEPWRTTMRLSFTVDRFPGATSPPRGRDPGPSNVEVYTLVRDAVLHYTTAPQAVGE
jgi:hypothetical protein